MHCKTVICPQEDLFKIDIKKSTSPASGFDGVCGYHSPVGEHFACPASRALSAQLCAVTVCTAQSLWGKRSLGWATAAFKWHLPSHYSCSSQCFRAAFFSWGLHPPCVWHVRMRGWGMPGSASCFGVNCLIPAWPRTTFLPDGGLQKMEQ